MPKLPTVSCKQLLRLLSQLDYRIDRQRGSHVRLKKILPEGHHSITIPAHKELAKGTLNDILNTLSRHNNLPKQELIERLKSVKKTSFSRQ